MLQMLCTCRKIFLGYGTLHVAFDGCRTMLGEVNQYAIWSPVQRVAAWLPIQVHAYVFRRTRPLSKPNGSAPSARSAVRAGRLTGLTVRAPKGGGAVDVSYS